MILKPILDRLFKLREKTSQAVVGDASDAASDAHEKPFLDHLEDLRKMFFRMIIAQFIFAAACFVFHDTLFNATYLPLESPLILDKDGSTLRSKIELIILSPAEAFMLSLKVAFISGFILAFPFHAFFLAGFIFPGLTPEEKKYLKPGIAIGFILFLLGASFAFCFALPFALKFLFTYGENLGITSTWRLGYYIGFVTQVTLIFGFCWELPLVVTILVKLRLLTFRAMKGSRTMAIMVLVVLSAVLTPPDPVTMVFMAVPLVFLYEICIWIAYFLDRKREAEEAAEEAEYQEWLAKHKEEEACQKLAEASSAREANKSVDEWNDDYDYDADHEDYYTSENDPSGHRTADDDSWIDQYSENLSEVECPEDKANIARCRKRRALIEAAKAQAESLVNINHASLDELTRLPGIGEATARKIIDGGPYGTVDELLNIEGITQERLDVISPRLFAG